MSYTYRSVTFYVNGDERRVHVLETPASNVRPRIINKSLAETSQVGVNGTFYDYDAFTDTAGESLGMIYWHYDNNPSDRQTENEDSQIRKNLITYENSYGNVVPVTVNAADLEGVRDSYSNVHAIIGGRSFQSSNYDNNLPYGARDHRTVIGYSGNIVIMMVTEADFPNSTSTVPDMLEAIEAAGYNASNFVMIDGGSSSNMRLGAGPDNFYGGGTGSRELASMVSLIDV
ncbi:phosphodiester glycosidase family protein [Salibacterium aidingense]|uniref:phosphodiester glycosidase family protein n=1 Tax=Salibacterium aidingense TaxID=384933 RepID=UPI0003F5ED96|nr:phosphodiester glycosidase family protein [Salibacterium aidingense]